MHNEDQIPSDIRDHIKELVEKAIEEDLSLGIVSYPGHDCNERYVRLLYKGKQLGEDFRIS